MQETQSFFYWANLSCTKNDVCLCLPDSPAKTLGKASLLNFHPWPVRQWQDNVWDLAPLAMTPLQASLRSIHNDREGQIRQWVWECSEKFQVLCLLQELSSPPSNSTHNYIKHVGSYGHLILIYFFFMPREGAWQMGDLDCFSSNNVS